MIGFEQSRLPAGVEEAIEGPGDRADLIMPRQEGDRAVEVALGQLLGPLGDGTERAQQAQGRETEEQAGQQGHAECGPAHGRHGGVEEGIIHIEGETDEEDAVDLAGPVESRLIDGEEIATEQGGPSAIGRACAQLGLGGMIGGQNCADRAFPVFLLHRRDAAHESVAPGIVGEDRGSAARIGDRHIDDGGVGQGGEARRLDGGDEAAIKLQPAAVDPSVEDQRQGPKMTLAFLLLPKFELRRDLTRRGQPEQGRHPRHRDRREEDDLGREAAKGWHRGARAEDCPPPLRKIRK